MTSPTRKPLARVKQSAGEDTERLSKAIRSEVADLHRRPGRRPTAARRFA